MEENTRTMTRELFNRDRRSMVYREPVTSAGIEVPADCTVVTPTSGAVGVDISFDSAKSWYRLAPGCVFGVSQGGVMVRSTTQNAVEVGFRAGAIRAPAVLLNTQLEEDGGQITMQAPLGADCTLFYTDMTGEQVMENITCGAGENAPLRRFNAQLGSTAVLVGKVYL